MFAFCHVVKSLLCRAQFTRQGLDRVIRNLPLLVLFLRSRLNGSLQTSDLAHVILSRSFKLVNLALKYLN